jgi:AhpD family alkylhydroperoxidase
MIKLSFNFGFLIWKTIYELRNRNLKIKEMKKRLNMKNILPDAYRILTNLDELVKQASISEAHLELIKIRASQLNGCAYCVNIHTNDAKKLGEMDQKLQLINVWKEAEGIFTKEEQLLFKITEQVTLISYSGLSDSIYEQAIEMFGELKMAQIIMAIISINSWNRIGVSLKLKTVL